MPTPTPPKCSQVNCGRPPASRWLKTIVVPKTITNALAMPARKRIVEKTAIPSNSAMAKHRTALSAEGRKEHCLLTSAAPAVRSEIGPDQISRIIGGSDDARIRRRQAQRLHHRRQDWREDEAAHPHGHEHGKHAAQGVTERRVDLPGVHGADHIGGQWACKPDFARSGRSRQISRVRAGSTARQAPQMWPTSLPRCSQNALKVSVVSERAIPGMSRIRSLTNLPTSSS